MAGFGILTEGGLAAPHDPVDVAEAAALLEERYGIAGPMTRFATEKDDTFRVESPSGRHVLKIANPDEPAPEIDFQVQLLDHVARIDPGLPVPRVVPDRSGALQSTMHDAAGRVRCVRLMSYLAGVPLDRTASTPAQRLDIGRTLARLRLSMASFAHPADSRRLAWDVRHVAELEPLLDEITDAPRRSRLEAGLERLSGLAGRVAALRTQVLHNDFSTSNLLVDGAGGRRLTGVIDFGDAVRTAVAVDVSTALLNQLPRNADPTTDLFAHGRDVLRGYLALTDLTDEELTLVPHLVMARVIARALITTLRARLQPSNRTYILRNTEQGWAQLEWFLRRSVGEVSAALLGRPGSV